MSDLDDVTLGEVARRVDRVDSEMRAGFAQLRDEIRSLNFVPAAVYAADRSADADRLRRLETAEATAAQRAWQSRLSIILALVGLPLSVVGSVVAALIITSLGQGR